MVKKFYDTMRFILCGFYLQKVELRRIHLVTMLASEQFY